jgi:hypothetical protein
MFTTTRIEKGLAGWLCYEGVFATVFGEADMAEVELDVVLDLAIETLHDFYILGFTPSVQN